MERIGERIKTKRELLGLQLNELAKMVGITSSALSQIEKAKSFPSIVTLKQIAVSLQTTVGELIGENESLDNTPLCRKDEYVVLHRNESGAEVYSLSQQDPSKQMETFFIKFSLNADSIGLFKPQLGQVYGYLLSGELQFDIDNKSYVVQPGDSIYFNGKRNFRLENIFKGPSEMVWVSLTSLK